MSSAWGVEFSQPLYQGCHCKVCQYFLLKGVQESLKGFRIFLLMNIIFRFYKVPCSFVLFHFLLNNQSQIRLVLLSGPHRVFCSVNTKEISITISVPQNFQLEHFKVNFYLYPKLWQFFRSFDHSIAYKKLVIEFKFHSGGGSNCEKI